jgi:hypothetical protein
MMRRSSAERVGRVLCSSGTAIVAYSRQNAKGKMAADAAEGEESFLAWLGVTTKRLYAIVGFP